MGLRKSASSNLKNPIPNRLKSICNVICSQREFIIWRLKLASDCWQAIADYLVCITIPVSLTGTLRYLEALFIKPGHGSEGFQVQHDKARCSRESTLNCSRKGICDS